MHTASIKLARVKEFVGPDNIDYNADLLARCVAETTKYHKGAMTPILVKKIGERLYVKANLATLVVANILGVEAPYMELPDDAS